MKETWGEFPLTDEYRDVAKREIALAINHVETSKRILEQNQGRLDRMKREYREAYGGA